MSTRFYIYYSYNQPTPVYVGLLGAVMFDRCVIGTERQADRHVAELAKRMSHISGVKVWHATKPVHGALV